MLYLVLLLETFADLSAHSHRSLNSLALTALLLKDQVSHMVLIDEVQWLADLSAAVPNLRVITHVSLWNIRASQFGNKTEFGSFKSRGGYLSLLRESWIKFFSLFIGFLLLI